MTFVPERNRGTNLALLVGDVRGWNLKRGIGIPLLLLLNYLQHQDYFYGQRTLYREREKGYANGYFSKVANGTLRDSVGWLNEFGV